MLKKRLLLTSFVVTIAIFFTVYVNDLPKSSEDSDFESERNSLFDPSSAFSSRTKGEELARWFASPDNYASVYWEVLAWYPGGRKNGCVAFASTVLQRMGMSFPPYDERYGYVTLNTGAFSRYLEEELGFLKVFNSGMLEPGDLVFTSQSDFFPARLTHVMVFHSWFDEQRHEALVIDNQGSLHLRNIYGDLAKEYDPFVYALRQPDNSTRLSRLALTSSLP